MLDWLVKHPNYHPCGLRLNPHGSEFAVRKKILACPVVPKHRFVGTDPLIGAEYRVREFSRPALEVSTLSQNPNGFLAIIGQVFFKV